MILWHLHRFIFLKSTKTTGTSLEIALSKHCGPDDITTPIVNADEQVRRTLGHRGPKNFRNAPADHGLRDWLKLAGGRRVKRYHHHIQAAELQPLLPAAVWQGYLKFSIVRNPFDYAVSRYVWSRPKASWSKDNFHRFRLARQDLLLKNRAITHVDGRSVVDFMLRYEHFDADLGELARRVGLPPTLPAGFAAMSAKKGIRPQPRRRRRCSQAATTARHWCSACSPRRSRPAAPPAPTLLGGCSCGSARPFRAARYPRRASCR